MTKQSAKNTQYANVYSVFLEVVQDENVPDHPATMVERVDYANSLDQDQSQQNIWQDPQMYLEKVCEIKKDTQSYSACNLLKCYFSNKV